MEDGVFNSITWTLPGSSKDENPHISFNHAQVNICVVRMKHILVGDFGMVILITVENATSIPFTPMEWILDAIIGGYGGGDILEVTFVLGREEYKCIDLVALRCDCVKNIWMVRLVLVVTSYVQSQNLCYVYLLQGKVIQLNILVISSIILDMGLLLHFSPYSLINRYEMEWVEKFKEN